MRNAVLKSLRMLNIGGVDDTISSLSKSKEYLSSELQAINIIKRDLAKEVESVKMKNKTMEEHISTITKDKEYYEDLYNSSNEKLRELEKKTISVNNTISNFVLKKLEGYQKSINKDLLNNLYNFASSLDKEGWEELSIVKEFITGDLYSYFSYEDNIGKFEDMDGKTLISWYEKMEFGDIINSESVGSYEKCTYSEYKDKKEYKDYRKKVEKFLVKNMVIKTPTSFLDKLLEIEKISGERLKKK